MEGTELTEGQKAFIKKCKALGLQGCTITVNGQPVYVSFYN